jgi:hypothetical protein
MHISINLSTTNLANEKRNTNLKESIDLGPILVSMSVIVIFIVAFTVVVAMGA